MLFDIGQCSLVECVETSQPGRRLRSHQRKPGSVRVVTLYAGEFFLFPEAAAPVCIHAAVDIVVPFAIVWSVAFCTKLGGIIAGYFFSTEINVCVAVHGMMAVEAEHVSAVVKDDVGVGTLQGGLPQVPREPFMAHRTLDGVLLYVQPQWPQLTSDWNNVMNAARDVSLKKRNRGVDYGLNRTGANE